MKNLPSFNEFLNEGKQPKDWLDFTVQKLAREFVKWSGDKNSDAEELEQWVDQYCYEKNIEAGPTEFDIEMLIAELRKMGYNKIDIKKYPKPWYW